MSLLALQRDFRRRLTDAPVAMNAWMDDNAPGLSVYRNAYRVQLTDCLAETFAQTHAWLGGQAFVAAARAYIEASPPTGWTLGAYGDRFSDTLAAHYPDDPEVAELAQLEWQLSRVFEAADAAALPVGDIATIDWDQAMIDFVPSLRLFPITTNAGAIWSALVAGTLPPDATTLPAAAYLLVWRQDFTPCFRTADPAEVEAIMHLSMRGKFADLCSALVERLGETTGPELAGKMLGQWFGDGLVARATLKEDAPA